MDPLKVIKYPVSTEKVLRMIESENKLVFIVDRKATKADIKKAVEKMFEVKVDRVTTQITPKTDKKAYVRLSDENPAIDITTKMGLT
jgi:large subunit ribosomal protein L23